MNSAEAAATSEIWGDLYSVGQALFESPDIVTRRIYYQSLQGNNFERPSFLVKLTAGRNRSRNIATRWFDADILVQYYTTTEWDAISVGDVVMGIFSGFPEVLLPKYDFSTSPPSKISISSVNQYGERVPSLMGIRVDPESVKLTTLETPDENWQANIEFTMVSPRRANMNLAPFLTAATFELINYNLDLPKEVGIHAYASLNVTVG